LNGRNWSTLTALVPGAIDAGGSNQRTIRFAGRGVDDNNFTSDGVDATNILNQAQQPFVRLDNLRTPRGTSVKDGSVQPSQPRSVGRPSS
jgi:hypothetical protein